MPADGARQQILLRIELSKLLKENRDILTSEDIEALKAINRRSGGWPSQLRSTHGDIRDQLDALHDGTPPTLEEIKSAYDTMDDILDIRLELLSQINTLLTEMIELNSR